MKKFLSLVLALVMTASLVTVSAGAKEFKDDKDVTYDEAVAVISEVGVVDGDTEGNFRPTDNLSRGAAAKIICNLILGPTTAAELKADTAPYKDVPVSNVFSGYIAYCAKEGIISGYADGSFRPAGTLTGYAFMKMLLGALGYDGTYEGYTGANWSINVAKQAIGIGLNKGLTKEFNGVDFVTREEAALYAFNTLKATLVSYEQKITTNVNGVDVTITQGAAKPVTWSEGKNNDGNIKPDTFVQFAEEYFPKLVGKKSSDDFERPATQWIFDKKDIGTYVRWEKMVEKYTAGVSGKDLYDLLTGAVIDDNDVYRFVDGGEKKDFDEDKVLVRSNKNTLDSTGNGVLTEVYLDTDEKEIRIVSINTWLAQATANYSESTESATVKMYVSHDADAGTNGTKTETVDVEMVPAVAELKKDQYILVNRSEKDNDGELQIVAISDVEILEDCTVTGFSKEGKDWASKNGADYKGLYESVTTGGEKYDGAAEAHYDASVLNQYDADLLKDNKYNVYLDPYGYVIGVDLFEGTKNYVFIAGYNRATNSNISIDTSDAAAIFTDGTMKTIKVDVSATNDNIKAVYEKAEYKPYFEKGADARGDELWRRGGEPNENKWYTYTEKDGVYTLKPVKQQSATQLADIPGVVGDVGTIECSKVYLKDSYRTTGRNFAYGDDDSVYIVASQDKVDKTGSDEIAITNVDGVYTGVQEVKIQIDAANINSTGTTNDPDHNQYHVDPVYTVYDGDNYVIASIVLGEAQGANNNYAYILSGTKHEKVVDGVTYWTFDAVMGGKKVELTMTNKFSNTVQKLVPYSVQELMFDGDNVVKIKDVTDKLTCSLEEINPDNHSIFDVTFNETHMGTNTANADMVASSVLKPVDATGVATTTLDLYARTLTFTKMAGATTHTGDKAEPVALTFVKDAPAVVVRNVNNKEEVQNCATVDEALGLLGDANTTEAGQQFRGRIVAALNDVGVAEWVVFISSTKVGAKDPSGDNTGNPSDAGMLGHYPVVSGNLTGGYTVNYYGNLTTDEVNAYVKEKLEAATGLTVKYVNTLVNSVVFEGPFGAVLPASVTAQRLVAVKLDGTTKDYVKHGAADSVTIGGLTNGDAYLVDKVQDSDGNQLTVATNKITVSGSFTADVNVRKAYKVTSTTLTMTLSDGTSVASTNYVVGGTALKVTGTATDNAYHQLEEDGTAYGAPVKNTGVATVYDYVVNKDTTLTESTTAVYVVNVDGREVGRAAVGGKVVFTAPVAGAKYAAAKTLTDGKGNAVLTLANTSTTYEYTVNATDAADGVIDLVQVVEVTTLTDVKATVPNSTVPGTPHEITTGGDKYVKVGVTITLTETSSTDGKHIQVNGVNVGTPSATPSTKAAGTYQVKDTDTALSITMEA